MTDFEKAGREKSRKEDAKYTAFDQHKKECKECQQAFEFWCETGLSLIRSVNHR